MISVSLHANLFWICLKSIEFYHYLVTVLECIQYSLLFNDKFRRIVENKYRLRVENSGVKQNTTENINSSTLLSIYRTPAKSWWWFNNSHICKVQVVKINERVVLRRLCCCYWVIEELHIKINAFSYAVLYLRSDNLYSKRVCDGFLVLLIGV